MHDGPIDNIKPVTHPSYLSFGFPSLSIFMLLIFVRGLAWQYTAETISIVLVELLMAFIVRSEVMTTAKAVFVLSIFPLSLVLVATLEFFGFD